MVAHRNARDIRPQFTSSLANRTTFSSACHWVCYVSNTYYLHPTKRHAVVQVYCLRHIITFHMYVTHSHSTCWPRTLSNPRLHQHCRVPSATRLEARHLEAEQKPLPCMCVIAAFCRRGADIIKRPWCLLHGPMHTVLSDTMQWNAKPLFCTISGTKGESWHRPRSKCSIALDQVMQACPCICVYEIMDQCQQKHWL